MGAARKKMTGFAEVPQRTFEERIERAIELVQDIPLPAQIAVLRKLSAKITALRQERGPYKVPAPEELLTDRLLPLLDELIPQVQQERPDLLHHIGSLAMDILSVRSESQKTPVINQIGKALTQAGHDYHNPDFLFQAGQLYLENWQTEPAMAIAEKLEQQGRQNNNPSLFVSAGKLIIKSSPLRETRERGISLLFEGGAVGLAASEGCKHDLRYQNPSLWLSIDEAEKHQRALEGKTLSLVEQAQAWWLEESEPLKALEILITHGRLEEKEAKIGREVIQKYQLQAEAERLLKEYPQPEGAAWTARALGMPDELILELAQKASRIAEAQITALEQKITLLQIQIEHTRDKEAQTRLKKQLGQYRSQLIKVYLEQNDPRQAANYAEEIGRKKQARAIRKVALAGATSRRDHYQAARLAQDLGRNEIAIQELIADGRFNDAMQLAMNSNGVKAAIYLAENHPQTIALYQGAINFLLESRETYFDPEKLATAIQQAAEYLKRFHEESGNFERAAEMCRLLNETSLAQKYEEVAGLFPITSKGVCYLTTACCEVMGMPDDCQILRNLRQLRDQFINQLPNGPNLIEKYYQTAPAILAKLTRSDLRQLFYQIIQPASSLIEEGKYQKAFELYKKTLRELIQKHIPEASRRQN